MLAESSLSPIHLSLALFAAFGVSAALTGLSIPWLRRLGIEDHPNARSSHATATPRGGGWAVMATVLLVWGFEALQYGVAPAGFWPVMAGGLVVTAVSGVDDLRGLAMPPRLLAHGAAVGLGLWGLGGEGLVFQGLLPFWLDRLVAALAWIWFLNLFNFMDGIDGITGVEVISIGAGLAFLAWWLAWAPGLLVFPLVLVAALFGFLLWNWAPAKVFLGDVGSVPLGYLLGWLLILAALRGQWAAALILPLTYWADSGLTLARRALRGGQFWQAHREHLYQKAVQRGLSHRAVCIRILLGNVCLIALALAAAAGYPWLALVAGLVCTALLLVNLAGGMPKRR